MSGTWARHSPRSHFGEYRGSGPPSPGGRTPRRTAAAGSATNPTYPADGHTAESFAIGASLNQTESSSRAAVEDSAPAPPATITTAPLAVPEEEEMEVDDPVAEEELLASDQDPDSSASSLDSTLSSLSEYDYEE